MRVTRGGGRLLAGLCLAVMVGQAWAVNKCVGADGRVTYTDGPCGAGSQGSKVDTLPPPSVQDVNRIEGRQASEAAERRRRQEIEQAAEAEQQRRAQREAQRRAEQEQAERVLVIRPGPLVPYHPRPAPPPPQPTKPADPTRSSQMNAYPPFR